MKVLLTGSGGNFGTEFRRQATAEVVGVDRASWPNLASMLTSGIDCVIHAASDLRASVAKEPVRLMESNVMTTARLLEAVRNAKVGRFVFLSSCAVYGDERSTHEDGPCRPISTNGIEKLLNEKMVTEFCLAHAIDFQILRIFNMYGGDDRFSIVSRLQRAAVDGDPFVLNNRGMAQRDFIHVGDVAHVVWKLLEQPVGHSRINVGTGVATRISDLVDLVRERFASIKVVPASGSAHEVEYSRADTARLKQAIHHDFLDIEDYVRAGFSVTRRQRSGMRNPDGENAGHS